MTGIGMTIMVLGIICFCIGWMSSPKNGKVLGMGGLMMLGGMFIGIGGNPAKDMRTVEIWYQMCWYLNEIG